MTTQEKIKAGYWSIATQKNLILFQHFDVCTSKSVLNTSFSDVMPCPFFTLPKCMLWGLLRVIPFLEKDRSKRNKERSNHANHLTY
jgi:hypothetical protein